MSEADELRQLLKQKGIRPDVIQTMLLYKTYKELKSLREELSRQHRRTNCSLRVSTNLTVAHDEEPLGLEANGITYLWITVEHADAVFTFRLKQTNQFKSNPFIGLTGTNISQHEFTEVYITNATASGQAIIQVGWRD